MSNEKIKTQKVNGDASSKEDDNVSSKTVDMLMCHIEAVASILRIGPLTAPQIQTVVSAVIIGMLSNPYKATTQILNTVHAHLQNKQAPNGVADEIKNADVAEPIEVVKN